MARRSFLFLAFVIAGLVFSWPADRSLSGAEVSALFAADSSVGDEVENSQEEGKDVEGEEADFAPDDFPAEENPGDYHIAPGLPDDEEGTYEPPEEDG